MRASHPDFRIVPAHEVLARQGMKIPGCDEYLRLFPHVHGTDGFFAAVMERAR